MLNTYKITSELGHQYLTKPHWGFFFLIFFSLKFLAKHIDNPNKESIQDIRNKN